MFVLALLALVATASAGNLYGKAKPARQTPESYWWDSAACGKSKYPDAGLPGSRYVVGGEDARPYEFPWIVSMQRKPGGSHFCGGSLITPDWVVTASHCVDGETASAIQVSAGDHTRSQASTVRQIVDVAQIIMHENYDSRTTDNDIALLRLASPVSFNENVTAVCAPATSDISVYYDQQSQIAGWGTLNSGGVCCPMVLQWTWIDVINRTECERNYPRDITDAMVCGGIGDYLGKDTCQGDSGGPMTVINANGQFELVGLTSWGYGCASGKPGVYSNVPFLKQWVTDKLAANP